MKDCLRKKHFIYSIILVTTLLFLTSLLVMSLYKLNETGNVSQTSVTENENDTKTTALASFHLIGIDKKRTSAQVWQFLSDQSGWSKLNEFTVSIDKPEKVVIPPEELEQMELFLNAEDIITPVNELLPAAYIAKVALSSTKKNLIVVEIDRYHFEEFFYNSYGAWRLIKVDLETGDAQVLLQLPLQWGKATLDNFLWSPDGRFLALTHYLKDQNNKPIIIDMNTSQHQELSGEIDLYGPFDWSPESTTIVFYFSQWHVKTQGGIIWLCEVEASVCRDIELEELWVHQSRFSNIDWAPDGKQIVFSATTTDPNSIDSMPPKLYLLNLENKFIHQIRLDLEKVLEHPRWSPDGRFIAVDYKEQVLAQSQTVVIIDPALERVINQISLPTGWIWGADSRTIWRLSGQYPDKLTMIDIFNNSSQSIMLPGALKGKIIGFNIIDN